MYDLPSTNVLILQCIITYDTNKCHLISYIPRVIPILSCWFRYPTPVIVMVKLTRQLQDQQNSAIICLYLTLASIIKEQLPSFSQYVGTATIAALISPTLVLKRLPTTFVPISSFPTCSSPLPSTASGAREASFYHWMYPSQRTSGMPTSSQFIPSPFTIPGIVLFNSSRFG